MTRRTPTTHTARFQTHPPFEPSPPPPRIVPVRMPTVAEIRHAVLDRLPNTQGMALDAVAAQVMREICGMSTPQVAVALGYGSHSGIVEMGKKMRGHDGLRAAANDVIERFMPRFEQLAPLPTEAGRAVCDVG